MYSISKRNINVLFWVNFFGAISFLQPVLTLFYLENGLSEANILMILMCWSGAVLIGEIPAGVFADRFGPKISFLVGSTIKLFSVVVLLLSHDLSLFMLFSFLNGLSVTFFSGADEALIYESLKKDNKQSKMDEAMGKVQSAGFISMILAVLLGSVIAKDLDQQQFQLLILCSLIAYLIELILLFYIHEPDVEITVSEASVNKVVEGIFVIKKAPQLLMMFLNLTLVFIPTVAVFEKFDQPLMTDAGLPVYLIGPTYAVGALLAFFSSRNISFLTKKVSRVALMYASGFLSAGGLLIAALFQDTLWLILGVILFLRFIGAIRYPIYSQLSNDVIPSNVRATTISLLSILDSIFDLIVFVSLLLFAVEGVSGILLGAAVIALLGSMIPIHNARVRRGNVAIPKEFQ